MSECDTLVEKKKRFHARRDSREQYNKEPRRKGGWRRRRRKGKERNTGIPLLWREQTRGNRSIGDRAFSATVQVAILIYSIAKCLPRSVGIRAEARVRKEEKRERERRKKDRPRDSADRRSPIVPGRQGRIWSPRSIIINPVRTSRGDDASSSVVACAVFSAASTRISRN